MRYSKIRQKVTSVVGTYGPKGCLPQATWPRRGKERVGNYQLAG